MSRVCEACNKRVSFGNSIATRGIAIYKGGVGIKKTGITRRRFKPNIQRIRIQDKNGTVRRMKVCSKCIRAGKVRKPDRREIPEGLKARMRAREEAKSPAARRERAKAAGDRRRKRRAEAAARMAAKAAKA